MNLERGVRRLTVVASLALLLIGLGVTALEVYRAHLYVAGERQMAECLEPVVSAPRDGDRFKERLRYCQDVVDRPPFPPRVRLLLGTFVALHSADIAAEASEELLFPIIERPRLFAWLVGGILTAVLAALPWGVFYPVRWIMRGFYKL